MVLGEGDQKDAVALTWPLEAKRRPVVRVVGIERARIRGRTELAGPRPVAV